MEAADADALEVEDSLTDEVGIAPAEGLEVGEEVDVDDGGVGSGDEFFEAIANGAANVGPGEGFAIPLPHGVEVGVERFDGGHDVFDVGCVSADDDGRLGDGVADLLCEFGKAVFHARDDGFGGPLWTVVWAHGFAEGHEDADAGILADELGDAVAGVVAGERRGRGEVEGNVVRAGEGVAEMNVVEALQYPDAALVGFSGEPVEHCDVLFELCGG